MFGVSDCIADCVWFAVPQATEWQRIGNQIDAMIAEHRISQACFSCVTSKSTQDSEHYIFQGCEAFSLTSQKDVNGHQKGQVQFVGGYLSLLEPR